MGIIDRTSQSLGRTIASTRSVNDIRRIAVHHSATASGNTAAFENSWRNNPGMGAPNAVGGYHEVILLNGDIEVNYLPTQVSYGVGGQNADTYHICVVGNFTQTQLGGVQLQVLLDRIRVNLNRLPNAIVDRVLGHREFPNQATLCPAVNMSNIRNQVRQTPTPSPSEPGSHIVRSGETLSGIAQLYGTTVAELQRLNNISNVNSISVGQVLRLPTASNNPSTHIVRSGETLSGIAQLYGTTVVELQRLNNISNVNLISVGQVLILPASSSSTNTIRVGSSVRVNSSARTWATGENIPSWVTGQTYTVQQLRNSNNELLLAGVMSWIRRADVTLL